MALLILALNRKKIMINNNTEKFKQHYDNLRDIADKMRSQEPDIDQLIPLVDSALNSYKICKERLDSVKKMLETRFENDCIKTSSNDDTIS